MSALRPLAASLLAAALVLAASGGCARLRPKPVEAPPPEPPAAVTPPPEPLPGERDLAAAMDLLDRGETRRAVGKLEAVIALGSRTPARGDALYTLALIEASPLNASRDVPRARSLLREALDADPDPRREREARFILALLEREQDRTQEIQVLRARLAVAEGDAALLRAALNQREEELRRIKEILLGEGSGD